MDKYIVVTTLCDKKEIADKIQDTLLEKRLIAGCQISERKSKYWWNNQIETANEFHIEMRSKENLFEEIKNTIQSIHDYEVCEISYYEIKGANKEILDWIKKETV
jgi:periplasmic divalent cation tolerance protein